MSGSTKKSLTKTDIAHIAKLANLPVSESQAERLVKELDVTVSYVSKLQDLNTENVVETSQVTGMENVLREDRIDENRRFTQAEALSNAKRVHKGFFVVDAVFEE
jgi:aspartyl-tRNA(Asn)/glutamyl-tRNA(Gln) amidotransferase subunit C